MVLQKREKARVVSCVCGVRRWKIMWLGRGWARNASSISKVLLCTHKARACTHRTTTRSSSAERTKMGNWTVSYGSCENQFVRHLSLIPGDTFPDGCEGARGRRRRAIAVVANGDPNGMARVLCGLLLYGGRSLNGRVFAFR